MPAAPRPQSRRCRYADGRGQCHSLATDGHFCARHRETIERTLERKSPVDRVLEAVMGGPKLTKREREAIGRQAGEAVVGFLGGQLRARYPGIFPGEAGTPPADPSRIPGGQPPPPPRPPPGQQGRPRVDPALVDRRKRVIAARGVLGFDADERLTEDMVKKRKRELAKAFHPDASQAPNPTTETMIRKINDAAALLLDELKRAPA